MLSRSEGALQPCDCRRLRAHTFSDLRLRKPSVLPCFEQCVEKRGFFALEPINLGTDARPTQEFLDQLIMSLHV